MRARVLERKLGDARRGALGDDLQRLDDSRHDFVFESAVQIFGVLAHDDEIDVVVTRLDVRRRFHRTQVRVEVERFAQSDVDRRETGADRRRHRSLERDFVAQDRFENVSRQRIAETRERFRADEVLLPFDLDARAFDDRDDGRRDFGADAVTGQERDLVFGHETSFQHARAPRQHRSASGSAMRAGRTPAARRDSGERSPAWEE